MHLKCNNYWTLIERLLNVLRLHSIENIKSDVFRYDPIMGEARAQFQAWAVKTYGGSVKTKTITREKYRRILRTIKGEIKNCADNSKFRFWMRSKGFLLDAYQENLFVISTDGSGYKKVAVVEDFYDIIYDVHVRQGAKSGNHAGQKRTYKAVTENYAFLPREAVTRFLMWCAECAKRSDTVESPQPHPSSSSTTDSSTAHIPPPPPPLQPSQLSASVPSIPSTTFVTPLSSKPHHHQPKYRQEYLPINLTTRNCVIRLSVPSFPPPTDSTPTVDDDSDELDAPGHPSSWNASTPSKKRRRIDSSSDDLDEISPISTTDESAKEEMRVSTDTDPDNDGKTGESTTSTGVTTTTKKEKDDNSEELWSSYNMSKKSSTPQRDLSSPMHESVGSIHDETSSSGNKDEDDDDDDDELIKSSQQDSERLKAFNMFVRLFVDENLDRCVPISRQPKEKVQAIIDSCTRQFPEFGERARKRIRTYLKSCRRNKRSRDTGTWPDSTRPTPAHLTSVQAEQILASACENESHNAKRMRLGLEPVSQPMPVIPGAESKTTSAPMMDHFAPANLASEAKLTSLSLVSSHMNNNNNNSLSNNNVKLETLQRIGCGSADFKSGTPHSTTSTSIQHHGSSSSAGTQIGGGIAALTAAAAFQPPTTPLSNSGGHRIMSPSPSNGPQDLSMKRSPVGSQFPLVTSNPHHSHQHSGAHNHAPPPILPQKLTQAEASAVRHLISGYRESAAFLLRSADELETLLLQQT